MNHISKSFFSSDGRELRSHVWELRQGGYRRAALVAGGGAWPTSKEEKLISFLIDRGFRVLSLDFAFGGAQPARASLRSFREAFASFARESALPGVPLYLLASWFSASALLPFAASIEGLAALALLSPVVELPPPGLKSPLFFLPKAELPVVKADQSGMPELLDGLLAGGEKLSFRKRDLKALGLEISAALENPLPMPVAAFAGEDDPWLSEAGRSSLARAGAKVYSYPRVKREPGRDRYADNYYADLGSFLDEVEASGKRRA
jgi:hypothetical protein